MSILVTIYFFVLAYACWLKQKCFSIACYLCIVYAVSGLFSYLLENSVEFRNAEITILNVFVYCALLSMTIIPFHKNNEKKVDNVVLPNTRIFDLYCYLVIISAIIVITRTEFSIQTFLLADYGEIRSDFYRNMYENVEGQSWWLFLPRTLSANFAINLLCFFYSYTYLKKPGWFNLFLLIATLAPVVEDVATGSRTTAVYWILLFVAFFLFFKKKWDKRKIRVASFIIGGAVFLLVSYIAVVTYTRFSIGMGVGDSLISYIGQPFLLFSNIWNNYELQNITLDRIFPLTCKHLLGHTSFNVHEYREIINLKTSIIANGFSTFIGDAILDIGRIGAILYVLIVYMMSIKWIRFKKELRFESLIIYTLLLRIPLHGIFDYVYYTTTTSLMLIASLLLYFAFKLSRTK